MPSDTMEKEQTKQKRAASGMTRADAGRKGGQRTKQLYGDKGFYSNIGAKGGKARSADASQDSEMSELMDAQR